MWPFRRRDDEIPRFCESCGRSGFVRWQPVHRYDARTGAPILYDLQWLCTNDACHRSLPDPFVTSP